MRVSLYKVNLYTYMYVKCTYVSLKYEIGKILSGIFSVIILSLCWLLQGIVFCSSYNFCSRQVLILQLNKKRRRCVTVSICFSTGQSQTSAIESLYHIDNNTYRHESSVWPTYRILQNNVIPMYYQMFTTCTCNSLNEQIDYIYKIEY